MNTRIVTSWNSKLAGLVLKAARTSFRSMQKLSLRVGALVLFVNVAVSQTPNNGGTRKFRVSDPATAARLVAGGGKLLVDYGGFQLIAVPAASPNLAALAVQEGAEPRDEDDRILLNSGPIDTTVRPAPATQQGFAAGKRLHLIHFVGPVKPEWIADLRKTGVEVVTYLPNNAYLIYGNGTAIRSASVPATGSLLASLMDWQGAYQDSYKIDPAARTTDGAGKQREIGTAYFAVQMVADPQANPATIAAIQAVATGPLVRSEEKLNYHDVVAPLPPERLAEVAARPDVISIQPYFIPEKFDERQDQIIAGNLSGNIPSGPGYLAWLSGKSFDQNQFSVSGFAVDITDSGIDNGTPFPNHFGLYRGGVRPGNSRVVYNRLEGFPNGGSTIQAVDGHGNLNAHIIGGYNNLTGFPHQDASGFRYGLGVAPFVRVGSSTIFDPNSFTFPDYKDLQARAYRDGARVSSNSWGANTSGAYNIDSQSYDALVRDAQPSDAAVPNAGNQEMVIVFANGNAGSSAGTVGSPATAKNVISVGAAENVQAFGGADGSGIGDTGADNANDIISFSSRGPCADGRTKPEIVAPGTHVSGGVWQTANPGPTGTADPLFDGTGVSGGILGSAFFPGDGSTQQFYTASSGTSHSTPCVAGGAALVRQYFLNRNLAAPSPAMTKSLLMNTSRYLTGVSANDTLPSNSQGIGEMNLGMAFDTAARFLRDQLAADKFTATGQSRVFNLAVVDSAKPLRVTIAWTDAPGSTTGNAYNNDLNLTVVAGGTTYRGNVFSGANSTTGGVADPRNNAESVFLPAGFSGAVTVTVTASNINSDGVPGDADALDQDFALVAFGALPAGTASVVPNGAAILAESLSPANGLIDHTETVTVNFTLQNAGSTALGNVVATLQNSGGVTAGSGPQSYGALAVGQSATVPFSFTASGTPGGVLTATFGLTDGATNLGNVTFSFRLAAGPVPAANGAVITAESILPTNGYIDPGEVVTVNFALTNAGDQAFGNLTATLQATGGITAPSGPQNYGAIAVGGSVTRVFSFTGTGAIGSTLTATLQLQDGATSYGTVAYTFRIGPPPDYFTEAFDTVANDTANQSWLFTPNGSADVYGVVRVLATVFPTDPTGGTPLSLSDDSSLAVALTGGAQAQLYGMSYDTIFVGSNGYLTFGSGDSSLSIATHFALPRISALFADLNPSAGGTVTYRQLADRIAVTWQSVPEFSIGGSNSFQIEAFFDGRIRITILGITAQGGLIGLSAGLGTPPDFVESDFSAYPSSVLTVTLPASVTEGGGSATATVTANPAPASNLVVTLVNADPAQLTVPASATILAGQTSATFSVSAVNDTLLDGSPTVAVNASAAGYGGVADSIVVIDNENAVLSVTLPASGVEGQTGLAGTLTASANVAANVEVTLASSDVSEVTVPATVTILAGQNSVTFPLTVEDDAANDGLQVATITASVAGWTSGNQTMTVQDNDDAGYTVEAADRGWYQEAGTHGPTNTNYLTGFADDGTSEQAFRSFFVFSIPALAPGETILSAELRLDNPNGGYVSPDATETLQFHQVSTPIGTLTAGTGGTAAYTDLGDGTVFGSRTVSGADDGTAIVVPLNSAFISQVTAAAGSQLAVGGQLTTLARTPGIVEGIFAFSNAGPTQLVLTTSSATTLTATLPAVVTEGAASVNGTVSIGQPAAANLPVTLNNSDPIQLNVPSGVTILAGQTSANFSVSAVNDTLLDGSPTVSVTALALGFDTGLATTVVADNETAILTVSLPPSAVEGQSGLMGTVTASANVAADVSVNLSSNDTTELQVPATVTIPAGQNSAMFALTVVDDTAIDGSQNASITASVAGWTSGGGTMSVQDNENTNLALSLPTVVGEGDGAAPGTVSISGTLGANLIVTLGSNNPAALSVPATVTILAGETSVDFDATIVDDFNPEPDTSATVTGTAPGFIATMATVTIEDDDPARFEIDPVTDQFATYPFAVTVRAVDAAGDPVLNFGGSVALTAASGGNNVPLTPTSISGFVDGEAIASVTIANPVNQVVLTVDRGGGHTGTSNVFNVVAGAPDFLTELFSDTANDTAGATYTLLPNGSPSFYLLARTATAAFPTDPTGGTTISLSDDSFQSVTLTGGAQVSLFETNYGSFFVGSNGYITFGVGDSTLGESFVNHFALPRISALFDDLNPGAGGTVTMRQLADRVAVTFQNVPQSNGSDSNNFQIEMFFDGRIRITILAIGATDGLIGLSRGTGIPDVFVETDFSGALSLPPTATAIADQTINEEGQTVLLPLTVGDDVTPSTSLTLSALSSNETLVPVANVVFGGAVAARTVRVTPVANGNGSATITIRVTDGDGRITSVPFLVTVNPVNDAPSFVKGANQTVLEDAGAMTVAGWATSLSTGPANESSQILSFNVTGNTNAALFAVAPAVAGDGTLTYTSATNANGVATITLVAMDDGGTANGGVNTSAAQSFTIAVTAVNDAPSFTKGADQTVIEDAGAQTVAGWATSLSVGPANESGQTIAFVVTNNTNAALFAAGPAVAPNGTLSYTPAANANGTATITLVATDNGGTGNGGADTSAAQTFVIAVGAGNDPPSFVKGVNQTVFENAGAQSVANWATSISPGPANESAQTVTFIVTNNTNAALFSTGPAVAANGTLSYAPAANANGLATITLVAIDNGGTANGGMDTSAAQTFTIAVTAVNDAPSFTKGADQTVLEDAGAQTVTGWATGASAGPADEAAQTVSFSVTGNTNAALFSTAPAVAANGTLTFTPAANANGTATITLVATDNGGTANGGVDTSAAQTFTIAVSAVNDVPSFTKGADQTVLEDAGAQSVASWATGISAGPANESGQTLSFNVTGNTNAALFAAGPAVAANGTLTFTPAANANGSATITLVVMDNGGTANGGVNTSAAQTFTIAVTAVNDAPSFTKGADQTVLEGAAAQSVGNWATALSTGPASESTQTLSFVVTNDNAALFAVAPVVAANGTLTFTPALDANGSATVTVRAQDSGGTANGGVDTSAPQTFTVSITAVNDAPSFTKGADQTVLEDAGAQSVPGWATALSTGPVEEAGQMLSFLVTDDNAALFAAAPAVAPNGTLTFTPAADAFGSATVSVRIRDDGGTADGGVDTSAVQTFAITVTGINEAPAFTKGTDRTVFEDAGAQTAAGWASGLSTGPANEAGQTLSFLVTNDNAALFSAAPAVATDGTLSFTPAPDANGAATVTVRAQDNGGSADGGVDTSAAQTFTITVTPVNDPPVFISGADQTIVQNSAAMTVPVWASAIAPGPADEAAQTVQFTVTVDNAALFAAAPTITPEGMLSFTPAAVASGRATVTVTLQDTGGTADGGSNTSPARTFAIGVLGAPQLAGRYAGLSVTADGQTPGHGNVGMLSVKGSRTGKFTGKLIQGGRTHVFKGSVGSDGSGRFGAAGAAAAELKRRGLSSLMLDLRLVSEADGDRFRGTLREGAAALSTVRGDRAVYHATLNAAPTSIVDPAGNKGRHTARFLAGGAPNGGLAAGAFPQGDGYATLIARTSGAVKFIGAFADGSKFSYSTALSASNALPFYVPLYRKAGSVSGQVTFRDAAAAASDLDGMNLLWFRPDLTAAAKPPATYPQGWVGGITTELRGSRYVIPAGQSILPGLPAVVAAGNARFQATAGALVAPLDKALSIDTANRVTVVAPDLDRLKLSLVRSSGLFRGKFTGVFASSPTARSTSFTGVVLQRQQTASGFFVGRVQAGAVDLSPAP